MKREPGYYWCKPPLNARADSRNEWESLYWTGNTWIINIDPDFVEDKFFEEIDERRIEREQNPMLKVTDEMSQVPPFDGYKWDEERLEWRK